MVASMKVKLFYTAIVVLIASVISDDNLDKIYKECYTESSVTKDQMTAFVNSGMKEQLATNEVKCFIKCVMEKHGAFKNGQFIAQEYAALLKSVPTYKDRAVDIDKAIKECNNLKGANDCDTAHKIATCITEHGFTE
ncbi:general odorant-binding protein 56h-like [Teleopsis dalmanni]|uniref:general odorant-binding protein 56h-like n=1 Tax=Teleopsis dalmanni TaxID=139649 RepID=UPI0018CD0D55|nr:general odorant-binding protein 56h-like [Teleopsis dalmanni]XP_037953321.1 general odorant-binding protein 56h-like [Teleopsis dalmanni]XP_037955220.1 general odorant-binding protein 56h-like [Teleopsis dalmanni]